MNTNEPPHSTLTYDPSHRDFLTPYLTPKSPARIAPHVTLTYASSLDGLLSVRPGESTALSSPLTKAMTHYLRSQHTAILVGAGTAIADDPGLNCRLVGTELSSQPRPIVLDPRGRWDVGMESRVVSTARKGRGKGVWVIVGDGVEYDEERKEVLERCGGRVLGRAQRSSGEMSSGC
ncbi:MAG: 2,5-diamino-6-(ribosylamino)-4(3H)-pyrimidinone 5'-phosphate reductase [Piccolia ochrophora]|nr:MAG: 2,5-diamino-6-(ribosylamino)-4(3H)-pyrimidinone 5'-phosphate reductase [Piccolia ochrophora]